MPAVNVRPFMPSPTSRLASRKVQDLTSQARESRDLTAANRELRNQVLAKRHTEHILPSHTGNTCSQHNPFKLFFLLTRSALWSAAWRMFNPATILAAAQSPKTWGD